MRKISGAPIAGLSALRKFPAPGNSPASPRSGRKTLHREAIRFDPVRQAERREREISADRRRRREIRAALQSGFESYGKHGFRGYGCGSSAVQSDALQDFHT